ncbi:MAG TPA: hypothetical protein VM325_11110 [Alphaproteobacteria bacterium]|nr:hypothetical protein [Alphaproteobacteria bacterium]
MAASSSIFSSEQARRLPWRAAALFALLLVLLDQGVGRLVERLIGTTDSNWGPNQVARLITRKEPGIVLGNSRAGAIAPKVLQAHTGLAFYNGTAPGQSIHFQIIAFEALLKRNPNLRVVVYELDHLDLTAGNPATARAVEVASFLYGSSPTAREIFHTLDPWNRLRFLSRTYRVNGAIAPILVDHLFPSQRGRLTSDDGFIAHDGSMAGKPCRASKADNRPLAPFKIALLKRLVAQAKAAKVKLVFVTAPLLVACGIDRRPLFSRFAELAARWGVPYRSYVTAIGDPADFFDPNHLNRRAALRYSKMIAATLVETLKPAR